MLFIYGFAKRIEEILWRTNGLTFAFKYLPQADLAQTTRAAAQLLATRWATQHDASSFRVNPGLTGADLAH